MEPPREPTERKTQALALGGFAVVLLALFGPILFGGRLFSGYFVNLYHYYFFATQKYLIFSLGQVPNWHPHFFSGFPISLTLDGFLNPIFVIALGILPVIDAYHWLTVLFFVANILACYKCGRVLGMSPSASWIFGWSYGFSGIIIRWTDVIVFTTLYAVLPLSLIACWKIFHGSRRWWWFFAGMLAYSWIGGFAELLVYDLIAIGAFCLFLLLTSERYGWQTWKSQPAQTVWKLLLEGGKKFLAPLVLSLVIVSPWLLTLLHYITRESNRAKGLSLESASSMPITASYFIHMLMPRLSVFYGGNIPLLPIGDDIDFYIGTLAFLLLLLLPWLWKSIRSKEKWFFLGLLVFGLLMSFPSPLFILMQKLPVLNWFRMHFKWAFITVFPACVLAGYAFDALPKFYRTSKAKIVVGALWSVFAIAFVTTAVFAWKGAAIKGMIVNQATGRYTETAASAGRDLPRSAEYYQWLIENMADSFVNAFSLTNGLVAGTFFLWFMALVALTLGFFPVVKDAYRTRALLLAGCAGALVWTGFLTGFDQSHLTTEPVTATYLHAQNPYRNLPLDETQNATHVPFRIYAYFPEQVVAVLQDKYRVSFVDHDRRALLAREMLGDNINTWFEFDGAENREPLVLERTIQLTTLVHNRPTSTRPDAFERQIREFSTERHSRILGLMNIKYVLSPQELSKPWKLVFTSHIEERFPVYVYENPFFLPRWYFAPRVHWMSEDTGRELSEEGLERLGRDASTILEPKEPGDPSLAVEASPNDTLTLVRYTAGELVLRSQTSGGRWVVFSETFMPGWRATIDERETAIRKANGAFQSVYVPAGEHEIRFSYLGFWDQFRVAVSGFLTGR